MLVYVYYDYGVFYLFILGVVGEVGVLGGMLMFLSFFFLLFIIIVIVGGWVKEFNDYNDFGLKCWLGCFSDFEKLGFSFFIMKFFV